MENKLVKFNSKCGTWAPEVVGRRTGGKMSYHIFRSGGANVLDDYFAKVKDGDWLVLTEPGWGTEVFLLKDFIKNGK